MVTPLRTNGGKQITSASSGISIPQNQKKSTGKSQYSVGELSNGQALSAADGGTPHTGRGNVSGEAGDTSSVGTADTFPSRGRQESGTSGEASGQGVALAGGATNGQGMQQNAVESEKKAATRADSKARTQNIRETRGEQYARMAKKTRHEVESSDEYSEYDEPIALKDIESLRSIGRKSVNDFTSEDIKKAQKWAYKFYQELGVKSPFFRAWFGEWRAYDKFKVDVVTVPTIDISQAHLENGNYTIKDTGWTVYAGKTLNDDTRHHSGGNRINVKSLNAINDILNNSVLLDTIVSEPDTKKKSKRTAFLHKLYTAINYNGQKYIAKISVEEYYNETSNNVERRGYNLKAIKIEPIGGQLGTSSSSSVPVIGSVISIADLYGFVKRFDKDFTVAHDVSEAVLNKDGTPKVFYHGTDSDFSSFSYGHIGNATGVGILGDGFYFSDKKSLAEGYGKRLYPCYLQMQNPYFATDNDAYRLNAEKLQQQEYDGVVLEAPKGNVYMVLDNTQIKSAETGENENIGTFDRAEGNIYHSVPSSETSNQQTSDDSAEAKRKARQEQAALAGEAWEASRANREGNLTMIEELRTEERSKRAVKAIPEFEELSPEIRRRVYSMMESAEQNGVDERTQRRLAVLLALDDGLEIRFDEHVRAEGFYRELSGGAALMVIHADALNGLRQTLTHELVHELQNQPGYERIHAAALKAVGGKDSEAYQRIRRAVVKDYTAFGEQLSEQEIEAEVVARIIEQQIDNAKFWSRFRQHKGIRGAIDFIRELGSRMKRHGTKDAKAAATVAEELADAVWASVQGIAKRTREGVNARGQSGGTRYYITHDANGYPVAVVENNILANSKDSPHQIVANYIAGHIGDHYTVIEDSQQVYIGDDLPDHYTQSEYTKNLIASGKYNIVKAKNRAAESIGEMIEIASGRRWEATKHTQSKDAKHGIYKYTTRFAIPIYDRQGNFLHHHVYVAELVIRHASDGKLYLYDLQNIKKESTGALPSQHAVDSKSGSETSENRVVQTRAGSLDNSIPQNQKKSTGKSKHSVESSSEASKQQTSGGVSSLLSSLGIKGAVPETRESLVALQRMAGKAKNIIRRLQCLSRMLFGTGCRLITWNICY